MEPILIDSSGPIYIIIGSSGGLGSYMVSQLRNEGLTVFGLDILPSSYTDYVLPTDDDEFCIQSISTILASHSGPVAIILSVASGNRLKGGSTLRDHLYRASDLLIEPKLLLLAASCLQEYSKKSTSVNHLINIGSVLSSVISLGESPLYASSKASSLSLARYLAVELHKNNIKVNTISPCLMARDEVSKNQIKSNLSKLGRDFNLTSYGDILSTIRFIVESGIKSLNGADIVLDDGLELLETYWSLFSSSDQ